MVGVTYRSSAARLLDSNTSTIGMATELQNTGLPCSSSFKVSVIQIAADELLQTDATVLETALPTIHFSAIHRLVSGTHKHHHRLGCCDRRLQQISEAAYHEPCESLFDLPVVEG